MRIFHLSFHTSKGGAHRAAYRIHRSLLDCGHESWMLVNQANTIESNIIYPKGNFEQAEVILRAKSNLLYKNIFNSSDSGLYSPSILRSKWVKMINNSNADIVNLHWVQGEMMSVSDIARIMKPIVWTMHDMWPFCGSEHYANHFRWRDGYNKDNRPSCESGFDLNRWSFNRKLRKWRKAMSIVAPSKWLEDCARSSMLMKNNPITNILHPIDLNFWQLIEKSLARNILGLPQDIPLILFGASGGTSDPRKGFDLLQSALAAYRNLYQSSEIELLVFGQSIPDKGPDHAFRSHYLGVLTDDISLRLAYSAADVFALPSRQDNLPLTCIESLTCGTPVVAFRHSGPPTIINHKETGYLATPFDTTDFAKGIYWTLYHTDTLMRDRVRRFAEINFDPRIIASQYIDVYNNSLTL